jgi:hypothetical protein
MNSTHIAAICVGLAGLIILGCSGIDDLAPKDEFNNGSGVCTEEAPEMTGVWVLAGTGSRTNCADKELNTTSFDLSSAALKLQSSEDAFGNIEFSLAQSINGFTLEGALDCDDVAFTTTEIFRGDTLSYQWTGEAIGQGLITGRFTGTGPSGCESEGEFRMVKN